MTISIGQTPDSGFDQPLKLLSDCHRRIEKFLDILIRVVHDCPGQKLNEEYRTALTAALKYFRNAAPWHTRDEEDSLFPRMRELEDQRVVDAMAQIDQLQDDHVHAEKLHAQVETFGQHWLSHDQLPQQDVKQLGQLLSELREKYRRHIREEDEVIFPLAGQVLNDRQLEEIGLEMAQRRGIDPDNYQPRCKHAKANQTQNQ